MPGTTDARGIYTPVVLESGWDDELATNFALFDTITDRNTAIAAALASIASFTKNITFYDPTSVTVATLAIWRAPYACTITALKGYRVGGTGATINAFKNTTATAHRASALSLTSASTWTDGGALTSASYAIGDSLLLGLLSITGAVTQINIQVEFTRT